MRVPSTLRTLSLLLALTGGSVSGKAILGVDLGSLYMKVALVQRNSPLEIVTNMHSKRKTEQMVLFDAGTRFYGADASSLLARKPHLTPSAMTVMLGRSDEHPTVQVLAERHYPLTPSYNETRSGVSLTVSGTEFTPEELVAMVLTHAKDITAAYGAGTQVKDCVLTVPSFFTQHERRALLDAAGLADLNVLALIDENTAAALHFGIDRIDEEPKNILFYNMGGSALQVSVIRYFSYPRKESKHGKEKTVGAFEVKGKGWDATLGGEAFTSRLVDFMADEFNEVWNKARGDGETKDVRKYPRAMTKIRLQANKVKHVLSANNDIPVYIDALHDDVPYQTHISRAKFEEITHDLLMRASQPITDALESAGMTLQDIDGVELIGGGMRIPRVQEEILKALGGELELGMHINSDESMALGAAFHGANVSTAFRVRHVGMADVNPFPIAVSLENLPEVEESEGGGGWFGGGKKKKEEEDAEEGKKEEEEEEWSKHATVFKGFGKIGVKKTIAFTHDKDVHCSVDYDESKALPPGTENSIERYNVTGVAKFAQEMSEKGLAKPKVSLQFELGPSGLTQLVKAEAAVEEIVIVQEEVEVDDEEDGEKNKTEKADETKEGEEAKAEEAKAEEAKAEEAGEEKKEEEKAEGGDAAAAEGAEAAGDEEEKKDGEEGKNETVKKAKKTKMVDKEKKKVHKRTLDVKSYHVGRVRPYTSEIMTESKTKLEDLARRDKERMMLEETKNKVESYIYFIKNKLVDDEDAINKVTTEEQRAEVSKLGEDAEEWMYEDGYDADLATFEDKYAELSVPFEKIISRVKEATARPEAIEKLKKKLGKITDLMTKWETTMPQVIEEERADVLAKVEDVKKWIAEKLEEQGKTEPHETPAFVSTDVPLQTKSIETLVARLSKKPKPKPKVEEKNDTKAENETSAASDEEGKAETEGGEEKKEGDESSTADEKAAEDEGGNAEGEAKEEDVVKEDEL